MTQEQAMNRDDVVEALREVGCQLDTDRHTFEDMLADRSQVDDGELEAGIENCLSARKTIDAALASLSEAQPEEGLVEIADYLVRQDGEPISSGETARLHYWRDKAIKAAERLRLTALSRNHDEALERAAKVARERVKYHAANVEAWGDYSGPEMVGRREDVIRQKEAQRIEKEIRALKGDSK